MAMAPSWGAETVVKEPLNYLTKLECAKPVALLRRCTFAVGVLEAEIM
jgi:hypothetical protein